MIIQNLRMQRQIVFFIACSDSIWRVYLYHFYLNKRFLWYMVSEDSGQIIKDRLRKTDDRGQMTDEEDRKQRDEGVGPRIIVGRLMVEGGW